MKDAETNESWEDPDFYDESDCEPRFRPLPGDLIVTTRIKGTYLLDPSVPGDPLLDENVPCLVVSFDQARSHIIVLTPIGLREANTLGFRAA